MVRAAAEVRAALTAIKANLKAAFKTQTLRKRWLRFCEDLGARPAKQAELCRRATAALDKSTQRLKGAE